MSFVYHIGIISNCFFILANVAKKLLAWVRLLPGHIPHCRSEATYERCSQPPKSNINIMLIVHTVNGQKYQIKYLHVISQSKGGGRNNHSPHPPPSPRRPRFEMYLLLL